MTKTLLTFIASLLLSGCASNPPPPPAPAVAEDYITALRETEKQFTKYTVPGLKSVRECDKDKCPTGKGIWMDEKDFAAYDDAVDALFHYKETYEDVIHLKDKKINQMVDGWSQTDLALQKAKQEAIKLEEEMEHEERWRFIKDGFYQTIIGVMSIMNYIK